MNLKGTKTEANLQTAFAGESMARNKYTYFASKAKKDGYVQIANIFEETAANEKEHAKMWYKLLNGGAVGSTIENLKAGTMSGQICMISLQKRQEKKDLMILQHYLKVLQPSRKSMRRDTASC